MRAKDMAKMEWNNDDEPAALYALTFDASDTCVDHIERFMVVAGAFFVEDVGWYGQWWIAETNSPLSSRLLHDGITFDVRESELEAIADARSEGLSAAATIRPHIDSS